MRRSASTRPPFSDETLLRKLAKHNVGTGNGQLRRWWIQKYNRPATDPLFRGQSTEALLLEWYEDLYDELEDLKRQLNSDESRGQVEVLEKRYAKICEILKDEQKFGDPLVDWWEKEVAEGRYPDLEMSVEDLPRWWTLQYQEREG